MAALRLPGGMTLNLHRARRSFGSWQIWSVGDGLRLYLLSVIMLALVVSTWAAVHTRWQLSELAVYAGLLACGLVAIETTRVVSEAQGTIIRDLQTVWYLATAIVLPPAYAFLAPVPLTAYRLWRMRRGHVYRRVFSNATISLAYGLASYAFHAVPHSIAGPVPGDGAHVLVWTALVAACGGLAWLINNSLLLIGIRMADPATRVRDLFGNRDALISDLIEMSIGVSLALVVAINPVLMALALPSVLLYRRYLMSAQLVAQARIDPKTGLLNAQTWRREAEVEVIRAVRAHAPLTLFLVGIDHFASVLDTAGRQAGDQVLKAIAGILTAELRGFDLIGRFGPERFAILMPQAGTDEARRLGERLRDHIAGEPFPIADGSHAGFVFRLTISIGIGVLDTKYSLEALMAESESALALAHEQGHNRVCVLEAPVEAGDT
jgi:diguanylate cyclase (GGDEF)-like protein